MDGLNDAARQFVIVSNVPGILGPALTSYFTLVCETQEGVVGVGALDGSEIKRLYVAPPTQSRGVGKALLERLEDEALTRGLAVLWLEASPSSVAFYEAAGFQVVRAYTFSRGGRPVLRGQDGETNSAGTRLTLVAADNTSAFFKQPRACRPTPSRGSAT
jgi:N-acetylglutamate synthase-like GNAT family acetyltransferase